MDRPLPPVAPATHSQPTAYLSPHLNEKDGLSANSLSANSLSADSLSNSNRAHARDSVISHPFSPKPSSAPSPGTSISSTHHIRPPPHAHVDPEKQAHRASHARDSYRTAPDEAEAEAVVYDQGKYHEKGPEDKAWHLLFFLSGPCALLSTAITLWTMVAVLISLFLAPLRVCSARPPLPQQLKSFLAPALNLQLHLVYSHDSATDYSTPMLIVIHLLSPLVAFGVAIAAWTAAAFWFFSSILGDPGGHDGHNDGKESILGVRNWWERWLSRGLRSLYP